MADNTNTSQKVLFKKGTKSDLARLAEKDNNGVITGGYEPGCFYLTTDTHHLYIGTEDSTLAKVNGNIHSIAKLPATGEPGEFYYLPAQNILAYYDNTLNSGNGGWTQLNPDTNTDTIIETSALSFTKNDSKSDEDTLTYTVTLTQKVNNEIDKNKTITADLVINSDDVTSIVTQTAVDVGASAQSGVVTVQTSGAGASGDGFQIKSSGNVTLSVDESEAVVINSEKYSIGNDGNSITLKEGTKLAGSVNLHGDDSWIETAAGTANGSISISHKAKDWAGTTEGFITEAKATLESESTFTAIKDIDFDEAGHINSVTTQDYALPKTDYSISSTTTTVKDSEQNELYSYTNSIQLNNGADIVNNQVIDIDIALPITIDGEEKILHNGSTIGSFYSSDEINSKLKALNAMTYMGPVVKSSEDPSEKLPTLTYDETTKELTSTIRKGDTYKVNEAGEYGPSKTGLQHNCEVGYLLIANSTSEENDNGYIHEGLYWDLIESGESTDTTYTLEENEGSIVFRENGTDIISSIDIIDDNIVDLAISKKGTDSKAITLTASHYKPDIKDSTAEEATGISYKGEFSAVTGVSKDQYGHITGVTISKYSLPESDTITADGDNNTLTFKNGTDDQGSLTIKSGPEQLIDIDSVGTQGALEVTLSHATVTTDDTGTTTDNPTFGGSFTAISSIGTDGYGHIDEIVTTTVTLPDESEYVLEDPSKNASTGVVSVTLKKDTEDAGTISLASDSLDLSVVNKVIYADLVWGSFI